MTPVNLTLLQNALEITRQEELKLRARFEDKSEPMSFNVFLGLLKNIHSKQEFIYSKINELQSLGVA